MTNKEALEKLKYYVDFVDEHPELFGMHLANQEVAESLECYRLAIAALEEKQAKEESQARDDELFRSLYKRDIE